MWLYHFYIKYLKNTNSNILHTYKNERRKHIPTHPMRPVSPLYQSQKIYHKKKTKKNLRTIIPYIWKQNINIILANQFQKYIKNIVCHNQLTVISGT